MASDTRPPPMPQYTRPQVLAVWAAAALPMAAAAWWFAPLSGPRSDGHVAFATALIAWLTAGLVWQSVLVLLLVHAERGNVRWATLKEALWLQPPTHRASGRRGGRLWLIALVMVVPFWASAWLPEWPHDPWRDLGVFLESDAGQAFFHGNWAWYAVIVVLVVANTLTGEELLFRGVLLPRMRAAFGRWDWLANGLLFAAYHLHTPWAIPGAVLDALWLAWPSRHFRSTWLGIVVHSTASLQILVLLWPVVAGHG